MSGIAEDPTIRERAIPHPPPWLIIAAAVLASSLVGRLLADGRMKYGLALVMAACFVPLVLFNLAAALAVYVAILFFQDLSVLSSGPNAIGVLVGLGWIGAFLGRRGQLAAIGENRRLLLRIIVFCGWLTLSITWAGHPGPAGTEVGYWWLAAFAFLITLTALTTPREVGYVALAFVAGSVISVLIGLATGGLHASADTVNQTAIQGRFTGGGGDPNVQAAGYVATMFVIIGLIPIYRSRVMRFSLVLAFALVTVGFLATQSRGGLLALIVATVVALIVAPRYRRRILGLGAIVCVAVGVLLATQPGALSRITNFGGGSSGRGDLWRVALDVFHDHPLAGVGAGNFEAVEAHFVLRPGAISRIQYLVDVPHLVHNTYLQLLAETGVVGLVLFLLVVIGSLRATWSAVKRFEARGRPELADLARAVLMGTVAMLVALFFISDGDDIRLWVLLAMGPALLTLAGQMSAAPARVRAVRRRRARAAPVGLL
jgi:O-antigen ligase